MRVLTKVVPVVVVLMASGCRPSGHKVDIPVAPVDVSIGRLDRALFHSPLDSSAALSLRLQAEYGSFYRTYIEDILQLASVDDPRLPVALASFTMHPDWRSTQASIDSVLGDLEPQRELFEDAFGRLKSAFPDSITPRLVAFNSGFNFGVFPTESVLGIGLEWFIGPEQQVVRYLAPENFPDFVKQRMRPEGLVPGALKGWLLVHYTRDMRGGDLLFNLVETGKVTTLLDALLPDVEDSLKFVFTGKQLAWCEEHEFMLWKEIVDKQMLFSTDQENISRIMNDAPFTNGFPRECPGHVGEWIGYRMVRAYLDEHPAMTLAQLFALNDPKEILKTYKPR